MIVVADTTPLNYLILIEQDHLLPVLYAEVFIPPAVAAELRHTRAPQAVRRWISNPPTWLNAVPAVSPLAWPELAGLDAGERQAIESALERGISLVLIDEVRGRQKAQVLHLQVRGTLGILEQAARDGQVDLRSALDRLEATSFRLSPALKQAVLQRGGSSPM